MSVGCTVIGYQGDDLQTWLGRRNLVSLLLSFPVDSFPGCADRDNGQLLGLCGLAAGKGCDPHKEGEVW